MSEFIYNINDIFSKVLEERKLSCYYIPTYQRGYKWDSSNRYDQVPQMLIDVYYAFEQKTEEYFLQYITVKKENDKFEVIDGQQRLTTLSLFFYCCENLSAIIINTAKDKVSYERYSSNVFEWVMTNYHSLSPSDVTSQDKYYLVKAAKCIDAFLNILSNEGKLNGYIEYLNNKVKIILNEESEFVDSESTFANLNDNKVPLTNSYLIKGLLLTLSTRYAKGGNCHHTYKEILDQRAIMGRMWDEIQSWIEQPRVTHYFFGQLNNGMDRLLEFVDLPAGNNANDNVVNSFSASLTNNVSSNQYDDELVLFNKFNEAIKRKQTAQDILSQLKHIYRRFRDAYDNVDDSSMYNKIGYVFFAKSLNSKSKIDRNTFLKKLIKDDKKKFEQYLKQCLQKLIPTIDQNNTSDFRYSSSNSNLTNLLLAFSVFPEGAPPTYRFDFYQYDKERWSFEHIYPQNPPATIIIASEAKPIVFAAIKKQFRESLIKEINPGKKTLFTEILKSIHSKNTKVESIFKQYIDLMQQLRNDEKVDVPLLDFLYAKKLKDEHSCGNMALISGGANSALSNNPYIAKRIVLQKKEIEGCFIPNHTKTIFNKALSQSPNIHFNQDLTIWDDNDVEAHINWMIKRNKEIRNNSL